MKTGLKKRNKQERPGERGFTLIETTIGLVIMMIVALGSATLFAYAVRNNSGGNDRAQSLAIAQQALETLRNARYTVTVMDPRLQATTATPPPATLWRENRPYTMIVRIDDMPPPPGSTVTVMKTITISVTPQRASTVWSRGTVTIVTQRARSDQP
ncbi:MAG TPA: prepilin-type N-terminal cleavage/methylation domain-containing protein [Pyrinomonadaceae bacterium]|jgi:type II secretory pathway pseudopilin PulG|nr:prepilin-type N-terminal cleavage/methylation domain-containing protein [Pyrinomonadaceae bacterium]